MAKKGDGEVAEIGVVSKGGDRYLVTVKEGGSESSHEVTVTPEDVARFAGEGISAEKLLEASFEFLLERESKESILSRFELPVIERYFPEYAGWIRERV